MSEPIAPLPPFLRPAEVARALGVPLRLFQRNVARLRREQGFPMPVPMMGGRYDPLAIDRWRRERAGEAVSPGAALAVSPNTEVDAWQARLDQRSAQIGRDGGTA